MPLKDMDKKDATFACVNSISESQSSLAKFALKFKNTTAREELKDTVEAHKSRRKAPEAPVPKTPREPYETQVRTSWHDMIDVLTQTPCGSR